MMSYAIIVDLVASFIFIGIFVIQEANTSNVTID